jgi:Mg-chelatase subunit ChlD
MNTPIKILLACVLAFPAVPACAAAKSDETQAQARPTRVAKPRIEVCFVLDTTGSMSGLIEGAKQKIWSIANEMISAKPTPEIRVGLIGYRDRGDAYVVKTFDLTNDIDAVYGNLRAFSAGGGGDMPESVNEALNEAVTKMSWSADRSVLKIIFLVGDAPPHMDYANAPKYPEICQAAVKRDLIINTVQCGNIAPTTPVWTEIAKLSEGTYAAIAQSGGMVALATPMDAELAELNRKVGTTLVAYGDVTLRRSIAAKQAVSEVASAPVVADRLAFNVKSGKAVQGEGELLDSLARGSLKIENIKKDQLPAGWQTFNDAELKTEIKKKQKERTELQAQIQKLTKERDDYIAAERKKLAASDKTDSFDEKVNAAIHAQAARKGITYGKD